MMWNDFSEECYFETDSGDTICIIGQYCCEDKTWSVRQDSPLFSDPEKYFRKLEKCKEYVEKRWRKLCKEKGGRR